MGTGGAMLVVGTENSTTPVQGSHQVRVTGGSATSRNSLSQTITVCPGTSSLSLTAWARGTTVGDCSLRLCMGTSCTTLISLPANYAAYGVTGPTSGSSAPVMVEMFCSTARGYLDYVTVG